MEDIEKEGSIYGSEVSQSNIESLGRSVSNMKYS